MHYYINGNPTFERYFWQVVGVVANERERERLLDGEKLKIGGCEYYIDMSKFSF